MKFTYDVMFDCAWCPDDKGAQKVRDVLDSNGQDVGVCICKSCDMKRYTNTNQKENTMNNNWTTDERAAYDQGICPHNLENYDCGKCDDLTMKIHNESLNNKENTMNTSPTINCHAIVVDDKTRLPRGCKSYTAKVMMDVVVKAGQALHPKAHNPGNMPGWYTISLPLCKIHVDQLNNGNRINIQNPKEEHMKNLPDPMPTEDHYNGDTNEENTHEITIPKADPELEALLAEKEENMKTLLTTRTRKDGTEVDLKGDVIDDSTYSYCKAQLEGRPFTLIHLKMGGHVLVEVCTHEDCEATVFEARGEADYEPCCDETPCNHFYVWLCLHHEPMPKLEIKKIQPWRGYVKKMDIGSVGHPVLCGNCRKNGKEDPYHPTTADVKACYLGGK